MISHMDPIKAKPNNTELTDTENILVVARGGGGAGKDWLTWVKGVIRYKLLQIHSYKTNKSWGCNV